MHVFTVAYLLYLIRLQRTTNNEQYEHPFRLLLVVRKVYFYLFYYITNYERLSAFLYRYNAICVRNYWAFARISVLSWQ